MRREVIVFGIVGCLATVSHVGLAVAAESLTNIGPYFSNIVGYIAGLTVSYTGHSFYTFRAKSLTFTRAMKFLVVSISGLLLGSLIIRIFTASDLLPYSATMLIVAFCVAIWTFFMSKFWTFAKNDSQELHINE